jgi:sec-independent protein translocase protein TatA
MFDLSPIHLILALGICLVVAGPKRLPELGRSLGRSLREFRSSAGGIEAPELPSAAETEAPPAPEA